MDLYAGAEASLIAFNWMEAFLYNSDKCFSLFSLLSMVIPNNFTLFFVSIFALPISRLMGS